VSWKFGSVTHGLRISQVWFLFAVPFGFALVIFRLIQSFLRDLNSTFVTGVPSSKATSCSIRGPAMLWHQLGAQTVELGWDFYGR
jgi:TRAP-type C4-dicarboxylate transport system permease small subunit